MCVRGERARGLAAGPSRTRRLLDAARFAAALRSQALVELGVEDGSELHGALAHLGAELNEILLVAATRLVPLSATPSGLPPLPPTQADASDAAPEHAASLDEQTEVTVTLPTGEQHRLRVRLRASDAPKCARCWRYVPPAAGSAQGVMLDDGFVYRGHEGPCLSFVDPATGQTQSAASPAA